MNVVECVGIYVDLLFEVFSIVEKYRFLKGWFFVGLIKFEDVFFRYRFDFLLVFYGLFFVVFLSEKVGIVGRIGVGKFSMVNVLFRIVELEKGIILIDNCDILKFGFRDLRRVISIIL